MRYPVPGQVGGGLIRKVIRMFKAGGVALPLEGQVLVAVSGGVDSMVLAHLLGRYGRKIVDPSRLTLLHFDHGWRPESAVQERESVRSLARSLGLGFLEKDLLAPREGTRRESRNLEEDARLKRQKAYRALAGEGKPYSRVLTAHHRDDQAETVLFRMLRGEFLELGEGILFQDPPCLRPFLQVGKEELRAYAQEERLVTHEDPTNQDPDRFRAWARTRVFPLLEQAFPSVREVLARYPGQMKGQMKGQAASGALYGIKAAIEVATGRPLGRAQVEALREQWLDLGPGRSMTLPGGVRLKTVRNGVLIEKIDPPDQG